MTQENNKTLAPLTVAIAADHGGYELKQAIQKKFENIQWIDLGTNNSDSVDYPDYAKPLCESVLNGKAAFGILICGTGIGISISANRYLGIRAALCFNTTMARLTREHNDANVLAIGARTTGDEVAFDMVDTFLKTSFDGGRHQRRIDKIDTVCG